MFLILTDEGDPAEEIPAAVIVVAEGLKADDKGKGPRGKPGVKAGKRTRTRTPDKAAVAGTGKQIFGWVGFGLGRERR